MGKDTFRYIASCIGIYLLLAAFEIFPLRPIIVFFGNDFRIRIPIYLILLLLVDPILTRLLSDRFRFREELSEGDEFI